MTWDIHAALEADRIVSWALSRVPGQESIEDAALRVHKAWAVDKVEQPRGAVETACAVLGYTGEIGPWDRMFAARDAAVKYGGLKSAGLPSVDQKDSE